MAKRLRMTNADYVAIAVSPALVMALVGSLVFFLIEVFYVGQHPARLNYVFAWFVFAAVLVARIAIEMGSERAVLFALPLGVITFLAMVRFVEQPGPFGQLVNAALLGVVWWSAHKLTWDCTLVDDDEDASGEGLMQQTKGVGVLFSRRTHSTSGETDSRREKRIPTPSSADSELPSEFDDALPDSAPGWRQRQRMRKRRRPHAPGLWVLYFSLAALPLFGMGQRWVPATDVGSRRYAFFLLVVYLAAGLSLLVTTSFLGLRRYLRQRRVEMPAPMAATWVGIGGALIVVIMLLVAVIPRPAAEVAISRVPWQIGSSDGLARSRTGLNLDNVEGEDEADATIDENAEDAGDNAAREGQDRSADTASDQQSDSERSAQDERGRESSRAADANDSSDGPRNDAERSNRPQQELNENTASEPSAAETDSSQPTSSDGLHAFQSVSALPWTSITDLLKWIFYFVIGLCVLVFVWKNFAQLANSFIELLRQMREFLARLFGGGRDVAGGNGSDDGASRESAPLPKFRDFQNPFTAGTHEQIPPQELVRYTFDAFEAWARDNGHARTPDQTPHELVRTAIAPQMPMFAVGRRMAELYGETAYGSSAVSRQAASDLRRIWTMMQDATSPTTSSRPASPGR